MLRYGMLSMVLLVSCSQEGGGLFGGNRRTGEDLITCADEAVGVMVGEAEGSQILLDAQRAYADLQSIVATITVETVTHYERGDFRGSPHTLRLYYQSPGKLRLEGVVPPHRVEYMILSDGQTTEVFGLGFDGPRHSLQEALVEWSGVSRHGTLMLPGFVLGTQWERETMALPRGAFLPAFATKAELAGEEMVGEHACYRIVCPREIGTWTFFVDKESFLIHRVEDESSEDQMRRQRELGGGGRTGRIQSSRGIQSFVIEQIDTDLDESLFSMP